jgi:phthalate 4,5-dioxygenase reductase subunit
MDDGLSLTLRVSAISDLTADIRAFELIDSEGRDLPPFAAGAHIEVRTPSGLCRQYSLFNPPGEANRYMIAVKREPSGRGGSASMHEQVYTGDRLAASLPRNYFPLAPGKGPHLLIAGGIGITPLFCMAQELARDRADFRLYYCARTAEGAPFRQELSDRAFAGRVVLHHDGGDLARALDVRKIVGSAPPGAHIYCCGPRPLMEDVKQAASARPRDTVHFEDFGAPSAPSDAERGFQVVLSRSGQVIDVPPGVSILEALRRHGLQLRSSCEAGSCGSCLTRVVAGDIDHRDFLLDDSEQSHSMLICVSRARGDKLVLDL